MNDSKKYPIYNMSEVLSTGAGEQIAEQMGGKLKEWVTFTLDGQETRILFKEGRPDTGENWAEKVTSELAALIELPHARYEFAYREQKYCVISPKFLNEGEILLAGNQLIEGFDVSKKFKNLTHTLNNILCALKKNNVLLPSVYEKHAVIKNAQDLFIGYLCFDAWIANTDRHDENWAIIVSSNIYTLAPTFDHASSLGRNENDENRIKRMTTKDKGFSVNAYVRRASTPIYDKDGNKLNTISVVEACKKYNSEATGFWIKKILNVMSEIQSVRLIFDRVPDELISEPAREFAIEMLKQNAELLRGLGND